MRWYRGLCTDLLEFTLHLRKNPETSARRPSGKVVRPVIASNRVPHLQMRSVGSHSMSGREKECKEERAGRIVTLKRVWCYPEGFVSSDRWGRGSWYTFQRSSEVISYPSTNRTFINSSGTVMWLITFIQNECSAVWWSECTLTGCAPLGRATPSTPTTIYNVLTSCPDVIQISQHSVRKRANLKLLLTLVNWNRFAFIGTWLGSIT